MSQLPLIADIETHVGCGQEGPEAELRRPRERSCPRKLLLLRQACQPCALHRVLEVVLAKAAALPPPAHSAQRVHFQQASDRRPGFLYLSGLRQCTAEM